MKTKYIKPTTDIIILSTGNIMISVSGSGEKLLDSGGNASGSSIIDSDSRRNRWEDEEDEWDDEDW